MTILLIYAFTISLLTSIIVIYLSHTFNFFMDCHETDKPHRFHHEAVARAGGIGIMITLGLLLFSPIGIKLLPAAILAFISGIFEDFHNSLSAKTRLILQSIAAVITVWLVDAVVTYLGLGITLPYIVGMVFTVFAIVGMMNAVNIIDGFNGLASGTILLILTSFTVVADRQGNMEILQVVTVTAGATLGFFILVFPKGKIFLGDGGAYLLGFMVAIIGIFLASKYESVSPWYVLSIFIYPVWEVLFSIARKLSIGLSPMKPDQYHFHMLVHRQVVRNNPLTALFILVFISPFMVVSTLHANCSRCNIEVIAVFVLCYLLLYWYLYKKDALQRD